MFCHKFYILLGKYFLLCYEGPALLILGYTMYSTVSHNQYIPKGVILIGMTVWPLTIIKGQLLHNGTIPRKQMPFSA